MTRLANYFGAILAVIFFCVCLALTQNQPISWNDIARTAAIESLVERGTWAIDDSMWFDATQDKVLLNGKFYSDKMPVLTLIGASVYSGLHVAFGATLASNCSVCAYHWLTVLLDGLPAALLLWLFFDFARRQKHGVAIAVIGTVALGIGTMLFPYALVLNHHAPAAASLFASFYFLTTRPPDNRRALIAAGFFAALAVSFDVLTGILAVTLGALALWRWRRDIFWFALGGAVPIVVTFLLDYQIAGTILPAYMITGGYDYPGSAFPATLGGNGTPDDYVVYAFRMFLGAQGLFVFNPLLLFALVGVVGAALNRRHPLWREAVCVTVGFLCLCLYLATQTGNLGGEAYGERWFVAALPLIFAFIFYAPPLNTATWKNWAWLVFVPAFALSAFSSLQGAASGAWHFVPPPFQLLRYNQFPFLGFKWNMRLP